jgi:hypothetical protein
MSGTEKSTDANLQLVWGANNIARVLNLADGGPGRRRVYYIAKNRMLPGLKYVGGRLVLDPAVVKGSFEAQA